MDIGDILFIAFLLFCAWLTYKINTARLRETIAKEDGIRTVLLTDFLIENYEKYYSRKYGEDKVKEINWENITSNEYVEMFKEHGVYIREYDEKSIVIPWEHVKSWQVKKGDRIKSGYRGTRYDLSYIEARIENMDVPMRLYILVTEIDKNIICFRKMAKEKEI